MKIYTVKKKPKLYGLLIFSVLYLAGSALYLILAGKESAAGAGVFAALMAVYFAAAIGFLIYALVRQMRYNPYSYNTIYYFGFILFVLSLFVSQSVAAVRCFMGGEAFGPADAAALVASSAKNYMRLSVFFIVPFSVALFISNVRLIKSERLRLPNVLGILLSFLLLGGEAAILFSFHASGVWGVIVGALSFFFLYFECMLIGAIFADLFAAFHIPERDKDYIVILGCRVRKDGSLTPLLRQRADKALEFAALQKKETGKSAKFIPSGGKGIDEPYSEAECVKKYLLSKGVPEEEILLEDRSTNTLENMRFSFEKTEENAKCAFATSGYHVFRSGIAANRARKFKAEGVGAPSRWYFWPNASVREFVGLLSGHRGKQAAILISMILLYAAAVAASYLL